MLFLFLVVIVLFFNYAAKVLLFFDMCKFLVQKNHFLYHFSNIGHERGKMQHSNTIKNHAAQSLRGVAHINITDI